MFYTYNDTKVNIEGLYSGQACFLVCSGPSLKTMDIEKLSAPGIMTVGVNNSPKVLRPKMWTLVDCVENFMISIWKDPSILKFVPLPKAEHVLFDNVVWKPSTLSVRDCPGVIYYKRQEGLGEKFEASTYLGDSRVCWGNHKEHGGGRSVMLAAIKILWHLGFNKIFLLGCDFNMDSKTKYAFDQDRSSHAIKNNNYTYQRLNEWFTQLRPISERAGLFIWNCTPNSALKAFDYLDFDLAIRMALKDFPDTAIEKTSGMYDRRAKLKEGVVYYNAGTKCLARLIVSINSCRRHFDGPIAIISDSTGLIECKQIAEHYGAEVVEMPLVKFDKNTSLLNKTRIHEFTPYNVSVFLDADTIVLGDFRKMFRWAKRREFCVTRYCNWKTTDRRIRGRIREWEPYYPNKVAPALDYGKAINTGVFSFKKTSSLMGDWFNKAKVGYKMFIPDEKCCQVILPEYKHCVADSSYNTSCKYDKINGETKVVHFHGRKHCRIVDGKYLYNCKLWYDEMDKVKHLSIFKRVWRFDPQLRRYRGFHDSDGRDSALREESKVGAANVVA